MARVDSGQWLRWRPMKHREYMDWSAPKVPLGDWTDWHRLDAGNPPMGKGWSRTICGAQCPREDREVEVVGIFNLIDYPYPSAQPVKLCGDCRKDSIKVKWVEANGLIPPQNATEPAVPRGAVAGGRLRSDLARWMLWP